MHTFTSCVQHDFGYTGIRLMAKSANYLRPQILEMARVLVVDDDPTARLTLQTILEAGGYRVEAAASAAEAVDKMDAHQYELVLSDVQMESPEAGYKVLAHARMMDYKPATALIQTFSSQQPVKGHTRPVLVEPENVPDLLSQIAGLISLRATRKVERELKLAER